MTATVSGYPEGATIEIRWNSLEGQLLASGSGPRIPFTIPASADPGVYTIIAAATGEHAAHSAGRAAFQVTGPPPADEGPPGGDGPPATAPPPSSPILAPVGPVVPENGAAPRLSALSLSPARSRAAARGKSITARRGMKVSYRLSERARVTFRVERAVRGRRAKGRCVRPRRSNRRARRCVRHRAVRGSFRHSGDAGKNTFTFSGRLGGRRLAPGRYRLRAVATDADGQKSSPRRRGFRIVRR